MAKPDSMRNIQLFLLISASPTCAFVKNTIPQDMKTTTTVRMAVAKFEFTPSIPIFAKIEVTAAENVMPNGMLDMSLVNAIAFDPYTHGYYKVTERVGEAFKDGLNLK